MNVCMHRDCSINIMQEVILCKRHQPKKAKKRRKGKKRNNSRAPADPFDMKLRRGANGHVKAGMGLTYLKKLDRERFQNKIAQAIVAWGEAMQNAVQEKQAA